MKILLALLLVPLFLGALLVLLLPRRIAPVLALSALAASGFLALSFVHQLWKGLTPTAFNGALRLDAPGALVLLLVLTLGLLAALVSSQTETKQRRFYALLLLFTATMALSTLADNLGILWAAIEATTLSSALLVGHHRTQQATEAAWKYLILASTGITIAFVATLMLAFASRATGELTLSWSVLAAQASRMDSGLVRLAVVLATVGYGTKAGLVPFHFWLPDAHSQAPSPISGMLSGVLLACSLLALDRFLRIGRGAGDSIEIVVTVLGAVTVLVGGILVLGARSYKRMLAHHSAENMGLVAFALGLGTPLALAGAYLHIVAHGVAKSMAFFAAGRIHHHYGTQMVAEVHGALQRTPAAARGFMIGVLALIGAPGLAPFTSKLMILAAAIASAPWPFVVVVILGLVLAFIGGMRHIGEMLTRSEATTSKNHVTPILEPWSVPLVLGTLGVVNVLLGLAGPHLLQSLLSGVPLTGSNVP